MIQGRDISHLDDNFNWHSLPPNSAFVICKATQGGTFKDPAFNSYWQHLKTIDIIRGVYHFLTVDETAQAQADNFLSRGVGFSKPGCLPPILDIEDQETESLNKLILNNKPAFIKLIDDWINIITEATGRVPIIYSYTNFFKEYLNNSSWPHCPLWLAAYQAAPPGLPVGWGKWDFWQYSQRGKMNGDISGGTFDLDYFNGDINGLKKMANY